MARVLIGWWIVWLAAGCAFTEEVGLHPSDGDAPGGDDDGSPAALRELASEDPAYSTGAAEPAARIVATAECTRLFDDCSWSCGLDCAPSASACVDQHVAQRVGGLDFAVGSTALAARCAILVGDQTCTGIDFAVATSSSCEHSVVNGCALDADGHGMPYSWEASADLGPYPQSTDIDLCTGVTEWFHFDLDPGETIVLEWQGTPLDSGFVNADLYVLRELGGDEPELDNVDVTMLGTSLDLVVSLEPAAASRRYFLALESPWQFVSAPLLIWIDRI